MLSGANIDSVSRNAPADTIPDLARSMSDQRWKREWWNRYGWNRTGEFPPYLEHERTIVRKIEIRDAYDQKQWCWKATDGVRETTWPDVADRRFRSAPAASSPDSGGTLILNLPDEPWNHIEISGERVRFSVPCRRQRQTTRNRSKDREDGRRPSIARITPCAGAISPLQ